jgi:hypothetical protein
VEHFLFNDLMEIHVLNLEHLPPDEDSKLADWLRFIRAEDEKGFKMAAGKNPAINEAYCKLRVMSEDDASRMIYEDRLKARRDEHSRIQGACEDDRRDNPPNGRTRNDRERYSRRLGGSGRLGSGPKALRQVKEFCQRQNSTPSRAKAGAQGGPDKRPPS